MKKLIGDFARDESGATAIEYALIVSLIGGALVVTLQDLGQTVAGMYDNIGRALDSVLVRVR